MVSGLILIAILMEESIKDWNENPVQTTLESVSIPLEPIPFPSVTICPERAPPDPWAYIFKIMNFYNFRCDPEGSRQWHPSCNDTVKIRKDLNGVLTFAVQKSIEVRCKL